MATDRTRRAPLGALAFGVLMAVTVAAFVLSRRIAVDQERRLLRERTVEVAALVTNAIDTLTSSLRVLGPLGASGEPAAPEFFERSAAPLLESTTKAIAVATETVEGHFTVSAAVGDVAPAGTVLDEGHAAIARRALAEGELVADLHEDGRGGRVVLGLPVEGRRAVALLGSALGPDRKAPSAPGSPFKELRVVLYASPEVDPDRLVLTSDLPLPLTGDVERLPIPLGADRWLLLVGTRGPLVGLLAQRLPWFVLGGGLLTAALATAVVEALSRRRAFALSLVAHRTQELERVIDELGETRAFLERLLTAGPVLVTRAAGSDRSISYTSPNIVELFGVSQAETRRPDFVRSWIHPEDRGAVDAALDRIAEGFSAREDVEYRLDLAHRPSRWVSATFVPETDDEGRVVAILGYILDIDHRRQAEQAQRAAHEEAEAANQAKSRFLSRMSHELRTPLNAVLGFGQLLKLDDLTDDQLDTVDHIVRGGRHLLDLINEVLDISRIEAGELSLSPEPVQAAAVIKEAVDLIRPLAEERSIQLIVNGSDRDCFVFADRQRVKQVLLNLLSNAVKYNRHRGIVAVSCALSGPTRVVIKVADTGAGIPAERLGLLFTPFERLGAEQTTEEGTGIGLALSKRLAEAMGGTLCASSTLAQGSTFSVELPRVEGPVERFERLGGDPPAENGTAPADRKVVLHIEDNLSNLALVERVLTQRAEVEVVAAMQGSLGLELARQQQPVIVLLDLHLPDLGGEEVLQRLRDDPDTESIPVVIVSADATHGQVQRLLSAGAKSYLTKPIDIDELLRVVDDALVTR